MKYISAALVASALFLSANAQPVAETGFEGRAEETCGYPTVPLLQAYSAKYTTHYYTINATFLEYAIADTGDALASQGDAAQVLSSQAPLTVPLYELYDPAGIDHFYTTSTTEYNNALAKGFIAEGITCYVYTSDVCSTVPLYRVFNPIAADYFYTTNETERNDFIDNQGYVDEGITAYVNPI